MRIDVGNCVLAVTVSALLAGCSGGGAVAPTAQTQNSAAGVVRVPAAVGRTSTLPESALLDAHPLRVLRQRFAQTMTPPNQWAWSNTACLTAGTKNTPATSIPSCGANAKHNRSGFGVLQLTTTDAEQVSLAGYYLPIATAHGLRIRWNLYSFDGQGADGTLLWMAYGDKPQPTQPSGTGGHLGYIAGTASRTHTETQGMPNVYLGIGFDEYGNFSSFLPGGPGFVPNTVAIGGAAKIGYEYLTGVENASGQPVGLPFELANPTLTTRPAPISVEVILKSGGELQVAFDIHDGNGYVTYISKNIVGIAGQPRVPGKVWIGFNASTGGEVDRHQIDNLRVGTLRRT